MGERIDALFADLARVLGVAELPVDEDGAIQLTVGNAIKVVVFGQDDIALLIVVPVGELPADLDFGTMVWILRRNMYGSTLAPFRLACDDSGDLLLWANVPAAGLSGESLALLIDAAAAEAEIVAGEIK